MSLKNPNLLGRLVPASCPGVARRAKSEARRAESDLSRRSFSGVGSWKRSPKSLQPCFWPWKVQPKTEKRPYLAGFLINYKHIAWSDKNSDKNSEEFSFMDLPTNLARQKISSYRSRSGGPQDLSCGPLVLNWLHRDSRITGKEGTH